MDLKTRAELAGRIKELALQMAEVAGELEYYGGFDVVARQLSKELGLSAATAWECYQSLVGRIYQGWLE